MKIFKVSNTGAVMRIAGSPRCLSDRILKPALRGQYKYPSVALSKDSKVESRYIHELVMITFIGKRPQNYQIDHIDGNKKNNNLGNLEYVTPKENSIRAIKLGLNPIGELKS